MWVNGSFKILKNYLQTQILAKGIMFGFESFSKMFATGVTVSYPKTLPSHSQIIFVLLHGKKKQQLFFIVFKYYFNCDLLVNVAELRYNYEYRGCVTAAAGRN